MNNITISYLTLRKAIGVLALALPLILVLAGLFGGAIPMEQSISQYYWSTAGDIFVGCLVAFGVFLISYNGYDRKDRVITFIAGLAMLIVAFFPCEGTAEPDYVFMFLPPQANHIIHYGAAIVTFSLMGVMSMFQFTQTSGVMTEAKKKRNKIYRICGYVIFGAILGMAIIKLIPAIFIATNVIRLFFWVESSVLWAFGVSWLVKGEALIKD